MRAMALSCFFFLFGALLLNPSLLLKAIIKAALPFFRTPAGHGTAVFFPLPPFGTRNLPGGGVHCYLETLSLIPLLGLEE